MVRPAIIVIIIVIALILLSCVGYFIYKRYVSTSTKPSNTSQPLISGGPDSTAFSQNINMKEQPPQAPNSQQTIQSSPTCPECPDCNCPECPACNCPVNDEKLRSASQEVIYLQWMVKFLGAIARRENAINRAVMKECPTTFSMIPMIQQNDQEFRLIKKDIGKDHDMLNFFNTNFTKLSGIPSTSYEEIL